MGGYITVTLLERVLQKCSANAQHSLFSLCIAPLRMFHFIGQSVNQTTSNYFSSTWLFSQCLRRSKYSCVSTKTTSSHDILQTVTQQFHNSLFFLVTCRNIRHSQSRWVALTLGPDLVSSQHDISTMFHFQSVQISVCYPGLDGLQNSKL